ncbi:energy transducer TonB [Novosphingobium sp. MMS21-SN21R]|uniref:energy transducer TonB n=1 Tax=Novosphingobium sp. MMS21-SN21R TaxID=2969298 RepID=UPI0028837596|nr:energy transducer TonB [Novosphingobium sp. MMS21-SN21R]MDT0508000.1 energy transducer TonB [Novosphingobium sp. MMS21-SN21R]
MSMIIIAALAAASSALTSPDISKIMSFGDYPQWALRKNESAAAKIEFFVDRDGKPRGCTVVAHIGSQQLAQEICGLVSKRTYPPAKLADGTQTLGFVRTIVSFYIPGAAGANDVARARMPADLEFNVKTSLLKAESAERYLTLQVAPDGTVQDCVPKRAYKESRVGDEWAKFCENRSLLLQPVRLDRVGQPATYVTDIKIAIIPEG